MEYTISTHNGSNVSQEHNLRNRSITDKENHINREGIHETWLHIGMRDAYHKLFDDYMLEYNSLQKREDRKIHNYFNHVRDDSRKHTAYELIISIGSKNNRPDDKIAKKIMFDFCKNWASRNPNLVMIGAYYHADEVGVPHVHIDYIPVAEGYQRGMRRQNGLVKSLGNMGFIKNGKDTAQIQWERRENNVLEKLCLSYGLEIVHPEKEKPIRHLEKKDYIMQQNVREYKKASEHFKQAIEELQRAVELMHCSSGSIPEWIRKKKTFTGKEEYIINGEDMPKLFKVFNVARECTYHFPKFGKEEKSFFAKAMDDIKFAYEQYANSFLVDERQAYEHAINILSKKVDDLERDKVDLKQDIQLMVRKIKTQKDEIDNMTLFIDDLELTSEYKIHKKQQEFNKQYSQGLEIER